MGSTITAHVSLVTILEMQSRSFNLPTSTPGISGVKGFWYLALMVTLTEPILRPWKEFSKQAMRVFGHLLGSDSHAMPVSAVHLSLPILRAIFSAPSFASVPELAKKTFAVGSGAELAAYPNPPSFWVSVTKSSASLGAHS